MSPARSDRPSQWTTPRAPKLAEPGTEIELDPEDGGDEDRLRGGQSGWCLRSERIFCQDGVTSIGVTFTSIPELPSSARMVRTADL
jgi:hypothetical protein